MPLIDFRKSDRLLRTLSIWPFSLLPAARSIGDRDDFASMHRDPCRVPVGDSVSLALMSFSIVVPIERRIVLLHDLKTMLEIYRDRSRPNFGTFDRTPNLEGDDPTRGSWHRIGSCVVDPAMNTGIRYVDISLLGDTESFLICVFDVLPADDVRYRFSQIVYNNFEEKIVPHPKLKRLFRTWGYSIYHESHVFLNEPNTFLSQTRVSFLQLLRRNSIRYHIGDPSEIPSIFVITFRRANPRLRTLVGNHNRMNLFWECQEIPEADDPARMLDTFMDADKSLYAPSRSFHNEDQPKSTRLIYVDVDRTKVPEAYRNIDNYLLERLFEWSSILNSNLCYQSFLDYVYRQLRVLRDDYYATRASRKAQSRTVLKLSKKIDEMLYWYSRYSQEYSVPEPKWARHYGLPELQTPPYRNMQQVDYVEFLKRATIKKQESLDRMTSFYHGSISSFRDLSLIRSNNRVQILVALLTIVTVILGIAQVLGLDTVLKLAKQGLGLIKEWLNL